MRLAVAELNPKENKNLAAIRQAIEVNLEDLTAKKRAWLFAATLELGGMKETG
jgi:hypothetical protein